MAQTVSFGQEDVLSTSREFEEISGLQDEMIENLAALIQTSAEETVIHYDRAVKIYAETDIFQLDTDNGEAILELLEEGNHIWMVPANLNGKEYELTITKGFPLREEAKDVLTPSQQQEVIDREGKWFVVGIGETDESFWERVNAKAEELADRVDAYYDLSSEESGGAGSREDQNTLYWGGLALVILVGGILIAVIIRRKAKRIRL